MISNKSLNNLLISFYEKFDRYCRLEKKVSESAGRYIFYLFYLLNSKAWYGIVAVVCILLVDGL